ncbi:MAG: glycosyltransferase [Bacteroidales bacterium]|nr:glycosyltransferase [Candidatus Cacconaster merdequi]
MARISIIIPVYNAEKYILTCLRSIAAQTLDSIEVILVDDHGGDNSMDIARQFASKHPSIAWKYTKTQVNSGPGAARNNGLSVANGEYVCFVDADDWIEQDFCEQLYRTASDHGADIACCDIYFGDQIRRNPSTSDKRLFLRRCTAYFQTFIYRRDMLVSNKIVFPGTHSAEDTCFLACSLICSKKMASVHLPLYHYVIYPSSVSQKADRFRASHRLASFRYLIDFAKQRGLYEEYRFELTWILFKKGWLMAAKDILFQ